MVVGDERTKSVHAMTLYGRRETWPCPGTPRVLPAALQASWPGLLRKVQIENIKLHIVTDIMANEIVVDTESSHVFQDKAFICLK